jgi:3-oxoacyl-[acyl-carrier protein] reductase
VAETVLFLVRDAEFMTGSTIRLDGEYVLGREDVYPIPDGVV